MTLKRAIEIMHLKITEAGPRMQPDTLKALILTTEAAECFLIGRNNPGVHWNDLLPAETKE